MFVPWHAARCPTSKHLLVLLVAEAASVCPLRQPSKPPHLLDVEPSGVRLRLRSFEGGQRCAEIRASTGVRRRWPRCAPPHSDARGFGELLNPTTTTTTPPHQPIRRLSPDALRIPASLQVRVRRRLACVRASEGRGVSHRWGTCQG